MNTWLWAVIGILFLVIVLLLAKLYLLQKAVKEIQEAFADRLTTDTNTLIDLSCRDRHVLKLANTINTELRKLRTERHRFQQGDAELKNAVTNISHDLRTPLTAIYGYLELLEQEQTPENTKRYLNIIKNRVELLNQLTEELFRYAVIITSKSDLMKAPVVLNHVLEESIAAFYTDLSKRHITPSIQIPATQVIRKLDAAALSRVFANLFNNALKYGDGDLEIMLSETGKITFINTATQLNQVQVGKLFDRFYTVETARKSTGLGLAIAKTLVEQMQGSIWAEYQNNRLSICIFFPDQAD